MLSSFQKILLVMLAAIVTNVTPLHASVPQTMSYQGILKDSSGNYLTGTYSMTFKLYNASSGGSALWTETQTAVSVTAGKFSVTLGGTTPINLSFNADYWLGITVASDSEMTPRIKMTSVGYAYTAENVVNGFTQTQHDALSHKNIEGVKENSLLIAKTNFKLDAYSSTVANNMDDMVIDVFTDASGIASGSSSNYSWRGTPNYDVVGAGDTSIGLLMHGNGADASTTLTDSSSGSKTLTANGNAQIDTAQAKFGGASILLDGTGDYVSAADSADWNFGSGAFTIDCWVRYNSVTSSNFYSQYVDSNNRVAFRKTATALQFFIISSGSTLANYTVNWTPSTGVWYHLALVRSGTSLYMFIDGVSQTLTVNTAISTNSVPDLAAQIEMGSSAGGVSDLNGWIDELRIVKGSAKWTAGFTPPASEYVSVSNATVVSTAWTLASAPAEVLVAADETLNSGTITYSVSRDNGTSWTSCTKNTTCDISSQPSGTQLKWKASINNGAELNAIAVAS